MNRNVLFADHYHYTITVQSKSPAALDKLYKNVEEGRSLEQKGVDGGEWRGVRVRGRQWHHKQRQRFLEVRSCQQQSPNLRSLTVKKKIELRNED
jgi:hypothetical protein